VALVLADLRLADMSGIELMARVGGLDPAAKRALLTDWGDREVGARLVRAAVLGHVDDWGLKPWQPGDEGFHKLAAARVGAAAPPRVRSCPGGRRAVVGPGA
jgi:thioredoxin reductase (NADPH)